jgi:hypothetical protein
MLELCRASHREPRRLSANNGGSSGSRPRGSAILGYLSRILALGFYAPVAPRFERSAAVFSAASPILGLGLSSWSALAGGRLKRKRFEINTYEIIRLKLLLESTLTEKRYGGTVSWNLTSRGAHRINPFKMILLQKKRNQIFWNDNLMKNLGAPHAKVAL